MSANDRQVAGAHYQAAIQHWDFVSQVLRNRYFEGQISRYATRWKKKNGVQDVEKAIHYVEKLREEHACGNVMPAGWPPNASMTLQNYKAPFCAAYIHAGQFPLDEYMTVNGMNELEREITLRLVIWLGDRCLLKIANLLTELLALAHSEASSAYVHQD